MTKTQKIVLTVVIIAAILYLLIDMKPNPKPLPPPDPITIVKREVDTVRVMELQDTVDYLVIKLNGLQNRYYKIRKENEKIKADLARMSDDELRSILTNRYGYADSTAEGGR